MADESTRHRATTSRPPPGARVAEAPSDASADAAPGEVMTDEPEVTPAGPPRPKSWPPNRRTRPRRAILSLHLSLRLRPSRRGRQPSKRRRSTAKRSPAPAAGRFTGPLPFQELRDAATSVIDQFGPRQALRDAFSSLGEKERRDLSRLVAEDGDWRVRARNIAAGSLGAGRVGKALAAQQISMARIEDLWSLTLSKEEADQRLSRVRNARRRDERRAQRDAERERRSDRVSRADLEKAQDGRVGAQIRIIVGGQERKRPRDRDAPPKDEDKPKQGPDVLDRLGY